MLTDARSAMPTVHRTVRLRFYGDLNVFLPAADRQRAVVRQVSGRQTVKNLIERIGVPPAEVYFVLKNGTPADFGDLVRDGDRLSIYPRMRHLTPESGTLRPPPPNHPRFVLDTHLGQLARYLRMMGFDTRYENDFADERLAALSDEEFRILLTRDLGLLRRNRIRHGAFVRATDPEEQLHEVIRRYDLRDSMDPLTRCTRCNGCIKPVDKSTVVDELPPDTRRNFDTFYRCAQCKQIYWKGSHYERMQQFLSRMTGREVPIDGSRERDV